MQFDFLFTGDPLARRLRRGAVESRGARHFDELLRLVDDVVSSVPDGTDAALTSAFGESIQGTRGGVVHECPELPFASFFAEMYPAFWGP